MSEFTTTDHPTQTPSKIVNSGETLYPPEACAALLNAGDEYITSLEDRVAELESELALRDAALDRIGAAVLEPNQPYRGIGRGLWNLTRHAKTSRK